MPGAVAQADPDAAQATVEAYPIGVAYRDGVEAVFDVICRIAADMRADETLIPEDLDPGGVDAWADSAVTTRFRIKVQPLQQWTLKRAFLL